MQNFDDIRFYKDEEVNDALREYVKHPMVKALLQFTFPELSSSEIEAIVSECHSIEDFQTKVIYLSVEKVLEKTSEGLSDHGFEELDPSDSYFYISNHRDIILDTEIKDGELKITSRYPQELAGGYDKLSAHKVFAMEVEIRVPEGLEVVITSNLASVIASGNFERFHADLKQGYCKLLDFSGSAVINTYSGDILVETDSGAIEAKSRHGKLILPDFLPGQMPLRLTSIDGDIQVRKTKY